MRFKKVYVEITNMCNKNCSFCSKDDKTKREIKLEEMDEVLTKLKPYTNYLYLHVKGEPLFHSKIKEILDLCKKYNYYINITTNGSLLSKNIDEIINNKNIRQINISLHSIKSENELNDILKSSKKILDNTEINIVYRFWALKNNLSELNKKLINELLQFHNSNINISDIINNDNIKLQDRLYINKDVLFTWPNLNAEYISDTGTCYGTKSQIAILVDGTVVPCCLDSNGIINLGNIYKDNLEDIINSDRFIKMNKGFNDNKLIEPLCKHCDYRKKCIKKNKNIKNMI